MTDGSTVLGGEPAQSAATTSPKRLLAEALWLALILGAVLALAALERRGLVPGQGYASSLVLLALGLWHRWHFRVAVRLFCPSQGSRIFPVLFAAALVSVLLISAQTTYSPPFGGGPPPAQVLHLLVIVPLSEELYFRGLLLDHLRRGFTATPAVLLCSLLFGLLHVPGGGSVLAAVMSLLACLLVLKTGTLTYAIQIHVAFNGLSLRGQGDLSSRWVWAVAASALIAALALASLRRPPARVPAR